MSVKEEFSKKLADTYKKLRNNKNTYEVYEQLEPSRGKENYKLTFIAKKKGGFGFLRAVVDIAEAAVYGNIEGIFWRAARTAAQRMEGPMLEPIKRDFKGYEIAMIFKRWSETIPEGYIETIGNTLTLPDDDEWIMYDLDIDKEMRVIIDFVKVRSEKVTESMEKEKPVIEKSVSLTPVDIKPVEPVKPVITGPAIPFGVSGMIEEMAKRIYLSGSLRNIEDGFAFDMINPFEDFKVIAPISIIINNSKIPPQNILIIKEGKEHYSPSISASTPLIINKGKTLTMKIKGTTLQPGTYKLKINVVLEGLGSVSIQAEDTV